MMNFLLLALSVALYPYVPDLDAYKAEVTREWQAAGETEPITFVDWDCYMADYPAAVDVTVYDGQFLWRYVRDGRVLPAATNAVETGLYPAWAVDGARKNGTLWGVPQMLCTLYRYTPVKPLTGPVETKAEYEIGALVPDCAARGWGIFPVEATLKERADWLLAGENRVLIDFSETMNLMGEKRTDYAFEPFFPTNCMYYVDYASVSASCKPATRPAADRMVRLLTSRTYVENALWPKTQAKSQYILPARKDVFESFAKRDEIYRKLHAFVLRPDNTVMKDSEK